MSYDDSTLLQTASVEQLQVSGLGGHHYVHKTSIYEKPTNLTL